LIAELTDERNRIAGRAELVLKRISNGGIHTSLAGKTVKGKTVKLDFS
jgi:hypothetical protein